MAKEIVYKEIDETKQKVSSDIDGLANSICEKFLSSNPLQKELQDVQWFLGEERSKNQQLSDQIQNKDHHIQNLDTHIIDLAKKLSEANWYLGEERTKREHFENSFKGCERRVQELEGQLNQAWSRADQLQSQLQEAQWYLGEAKARIQHLENQINR